MLFLACDLRADSAAGAQAELQRVRELVQAGALPRSALREAEQVLEDARREQTLQETLLQRELTVEQLPTMLSAATKLRDRARERFTKSRELVEAGALPANRLREAKDALSLAEKQYELAESRARVVRELAVMARTEERLGSPEPDQEIAVYSPGRRVFEPQDLADIDAVFFGRFGLPLPISSDGDTLVHRSLGLDHTGRIDVPLHPDSEHGIFLLHVLESFGLPFIGFRGPVTGESTGPHIHIGPPSTRTPPE